MTATVTSIAPREGDAADSREPLRAAQRQLAVAKAVLDARRGDLSRTTQLVEDLEAKVLAAGDAVSAEKDAQAEAIAGGKTPSPDKVRRARDAERDVEDRLDAVRAAVAKIEADLPDFVDDVARAELGVIAARNAVTAAVAAQLLERAHRAKAEFFLLEEVCGMLLAQDHRVPELSNPTESLRARERANQPLFSLHEELRNLRSSNRHLGKPESQAFEVWRQALLLEADAPPPDPA
jgi:hypothetical protein